MSNGTDSAVNTALWVAGIGLCAGIAALISDDDTVKTVAEMDRERRRQELRAERERVRAERERGRRELERETRRMERSHQLAREERERRRRSLGGIFQDDYAASHDLLDYLTDSSLVDRRKLGHVETFAKSGRKVSPVTAARIVDTITFSCWRDDARKALSACVS